MSAICQPPLLDRRYTKTKIVRGVLRAPRWRPRGRVGGGVGGTAAAISYLGFSSATSFKLSPEVRGQLLAWHLHGPPLGLASVLFAFRVPAGCAVSLDSSHTSAAGGRGFFSAPAFCPYLPATTNLAATTPVRARKNIAGGSVRDERKRSGKKKRKSPKAPMTRGAKIDQQMDQGPMTNGTKFSAPPARGGAVAVAGLVAVIAAGGGRRVHCGGPRAAEGRGRRTGPRGGGSGGGRPRRASVVARGWGFGGAGRGGRGAVLASGGGGVHWLFLIVYWD
jgi:hypothetical protein